MEQLSFYNSFKFHVHHLFSDRHTDNSRGILCHYLARLIRGSARIVSLSGEELVLSEGDIFYLPMGLRYHSYWSVGDGGQVVWESYGFTTLPNANQVKYVMQKINTDAEGINILDELVKNLRVSPTSVGLLYLFLGRSFPDMRVNYLDPKAATWKKAVEFVSVHSDLHVKELAAYCNMSESGVYAFFKQYANTTPIELKNKILIKRAIDLLTTTDLSVEEISSRVGFCNPAYFRKQLKRHTGKTPSQIRRERQTI